ncbi:hypothetical protein BH20ACI4_BH20ACI4_13470 [soil metagenome]
MFQNNSALPDFNIRDAFCLEEKTEKDSNKQILCVEDHEDTCELYSLLLPEYDFTFAHTMADALALVEKRNFDLYMMDNWLPDGSGTDLSRKIRALYSETPIVFISGVTRTKEKQEALDAGVSEYLTKPCDPDELQKVVKELIEKN